MGIRATPQTVQHIEGHRLASKFEVAAPGAIGSVFRVHLARGGAGGGQRHPQGNHRQSGFHGSSPPHRLCRARFRRQGSALAPRRLKFDSSAYGRLKFRLACTLTPCCVRAPMPEFWLITMMPAADCATPDMLLDMSKVPASAVRVPPLPPVPLPPVPLPPVRVPPLPPLPPVPPWPLPPAPPLPPVALPLVALPFDAVLVALPPVAVPDVALPLVAWPPAPPVGVALTVLVPPPAEAVPLAPPVDDDAPLLPPAPPVAVLLEALAGSSPAPLVRALAWDDASALPLPVSAPLPPPVLLAVPPPL